MKYHYLSYPLAHSNPGYGTLDANIKLRRLRDMESGDGCNVVELCFENHWGTHVDAPNHFFKNGKKICDYPAATWLFDYPQIVCCTAGPGQFIMPEAIVDQIDDSTDLLIIKTGWTKLRGSHAYSFEGPALSAELGRVLREKYPHVRAVAVEPTSISSMVDRERGRLAHQAFLDPERTGEPLLLIEGIKLSDDYGKLLKVIAVPLIVKDIDSAPITIIGSYEEE